MPICRFLVFNLLYALSASCICGSCLILIWGASQLFIFLIFLLFFLFFSFWYSHYINVTYFVVVSKFLDSLCCFFLSFFPLLFRFGCFYWNILKLRESFSSCVQCTDKLFKVIIHLCYSVLISSISFGFFLIIYISLLILPICLCMLFYPLTPLAC